MRARSVRVTRTASPAGHCTTTWQLSKPPARSASKCPAPSGGEPADEVPLPARYEVFERLRPQHLIHSAPTAGHTVILHSRFLSR
jgi:hypothetical protein